MVRLATPPGRRSIWILSSGVLMPRGPHHWATCAGSVQACHTNSRGASKTRVIVSSTIGVPLPDLRPCRVGPLPCCPAPRRRLDGVVVVGRGARLLSVAGGRLVRRSRRAGPSQHCLAQMLVEAIQAAFEKLAVER